MICFDCNKEIEAGDYKLYALDIPYINLFFHKDCFKKLGGYDKIVAYLTQRTKMLYNYHINSQKGGKNGRKKEGIEGTAKVTSSV